ncbi:MAG: tellurite resistance TerB family protein [Desulfobulbus sp.]|nr:MAG: tellurite resistance TerB family protein [Desulfobulbus sp.]
MFKPEKLLGSLLGGSKRRGGANVLTSQLGMGILGVAIAAADHYMKKTSAPAQPAPAGYGGGVPPSAPGAGAPPPPPPGMTSSAPAPPPPPGATPASAAVPPPGATPAEAGRNDATLLIRAMIAAANADGAIDQEERQRILEKFQGADLSQEERAFLVNELFAPASLEAIVSQVKSEAMARQVYGVSLLAIEVDTDAERAYLRDLAQRLALSQTDLDTMHQALGIANP